MSRILALLAPLLFCGCYCSKTTPGEVTVHVTCTCPEPPKATTP